jgi:hypothetical protein
MIVTVQTIDTDTTVQATEIAEVLAEAGYYVESVTVHDRETGEVSDLWHDTVGPARSEPDAAVPLPVESLADGDVFSADTGASWHTCAVPMPWGGTVSVYDSPRRDADAPTVRIDVESGSTVLVRPAWTVVETIHHGNYRNTAAYSAGTLADAVARAVDLSPYPTIPEHRDRVVSRIMAGLTATGRAQSGWADYEITRRPQS